MASSQKLDVEVELKSPADKFWIALRDSTTIFPKAFPDQYKSIEVLEGDGKSVGSVRLINYADVKEAHPVDSLENEWVGDPFSEDQETSQPPLIGLKKNYGISAFSCSKEKIELVDEESKEASYAAIDGDLLKYYKNFKAHFVVNAKGDGSVVKWTCEYEKASEEIPIPHLIRDFAVKNFEDLDAYILAGHQI